MRRSNSAARHHILPLSMCCADDALVACITFSHILNRKAPRNIAPDEARIYPDPILMPFERVADCDSNSKTAFAIGGQRLVDTVIEHVRIAAAKLDVDGVIRDGFSGRKFSPIWHATRVWLL